jgi:hypothetical protein
MITYGVVYMHDNKHPTEPNAKIRGWLQVNGHDAIFNTRNDALIACENDGWRGYTAEYPSGLVPWMSALPRLLNNSR